MMSVDQCRSTMNGIRCVRTAWHPVGTNVWSDPQNTHHSKMGATHWTDAAADPDVCAACDVDPMAPHTNGCRLPLPEPHVSGESA